MSSVIKSFDFRGCSNLRKLVISPDVKFIGDINLTDTPIQKIYNFYEMDESEIENGAIIPKNLFPKIKLRKFFTETGTFSCRDEVLEILKVTLKLFFFCQ
jgi:hypothetical protein